MVSENYGAGPETWARALRMCSSDLGNAEASFEDACERIAALEAENQALREFVRLVDDVVFLMAHREDGDRFHDARQRLATDHGLPLPGAGEDGR